MIEVHCVCGKTYRVPESKAGRKLQCKRCGNVQRVPRRVDSDDRAPVVNFRTPGDSRPSDPDLLSAALAPPPLDLSAPVRRCPSCGLQDEATVVVCVRCGYDWRRGERLQDAHEQASRSQRRRGLDGARRELDGLGRMAWASLSPLGIVLGPVVFARSVAVERELQGRGGERGELQQARQLRFTAVAGAAMWVVVGIILALVLQERAGGASYEDLECQARLERVGRALGAAVQEGPFPSKGSFPTALAGLTQGATASLREYDLRCPQANGLYAYGRRERELLTGEVVPDYIILWDLEAHADARGRLVHRGLRADGTLEAFPSRRDLDVALQRPPFGREALAMPSGAGEGTPSAGPGPAPPPGEPPGDEAWQRQAERFREFARECDGIDPDLSAGLRVEAGEFVERVGVPAAELLPALARRGDLATRQAAAWMLFRLDLPRHRKLSLARGLESDADAGVRLGAALCLRQLGEADWLARMAGVAVAAASDAVREHAERILAEEACRGTGPAREVLRQAAAHRRALDSQGDDAIFPLPPKALESMGELLTDSEVGREAQAVLYSADEAGLAIAEAVLEAPDRDRREAALQVLDLLRSKGVLALADYLGRVEAELDEQVRARALRRLVQEPGHPDPGFLRWLLDALREGGADSELARSTRGVLAKVGKGDEEEAEAGLRLLVEDLAAEGSHQAVLSELSDPSRLLDARIDALLAERWGRFEDPAVLKRLVRLLAKRPHEETLKALMVAAEGKDATARAQALQALGALPSPPSESLRGKLARLLARRVKEETAPLPRRQVLVLCTGGLFCARLGESGGRVSYKLAAPVLRSLKAAVRTGDRAALRALSSHPMQEIIDYLVGLLDSGRDDSNFTRDVASAIGELSGLGRTYENSASWRKELGNKRQKVQRQLNAAAKRERDRIERLLEKARRRRDNLLRRS